jgi:hypothetical protein
MAFKKSPTGAYPATDAPADPGPSNDDLRAQLKAARVRIASLEVIADVDPEEEGSGEFVNARRLTHYQDIERMWRLGKLSPADVARFQLKGQLPGAPVPAEDTVSPDSPPRPVEA